VRIPPRDGQRHKALFRGMANHVDHRLPVVGRSRDVEEDEFVGPLLVVGDGALDGIAGIAELKELGSFDDSAAGDIEAGDGSLWSTCQKFRKKNFKLA